MASFIKNNINGGIIMFSFYSRIVIAYDGSELGKKSLEMGKALAMQDERIELHVLHVMPSRTFTPEFAIDEEKQSEKLTSLLDEAKEIMKDCKNSVDYVVLKGHPAEMIIEYARNRDVDLIIMGSRGLSPLKQVVLGSVSHSVLQHSHCTVLIAK